MRKKLSLVAFATVALLLLAGCTKPHDEPAKAPADQPEEPRAEIKIEEEILAESMPETAPQSTVSLEEGLLEELQKGLHDYGALGQIIIDGTSMETLEQTMNALQAELKKLPQEEQQKVGRAFGRYMIDMMRAYPDKEDFLANPNGPPSKEAVEKFVMYLSEPFSGKNFNDFMEDAEVRGEGRPPLEEEMRQFTEEMAQMRQM